MKILCTPHTDDVDTWLKDNIIIRSDKKVLHIVPTLILYRRRLKTYRNHFKELFNFNESEVNIVAQILDNNGISLFEMDRFLLSNIRKLDQKVLSRREASVLIERILEQNRFSNNIAWKKSIQSLNEFFITISLSGLSLEEISELDQTISWQQVVKLYQDYLSELKKYNALDYGLASLYLLKDFNFDSYDMLIMDGAFLPLLPKHDMLINRFIGSKKVIFFLPIDLDKKESPVYEAIKKSYSQYISLDKWESIKSDKAPFNTVHKLANSIFNSTIDSIDDNSIKILKFPSEEDELEYIVEHIFHLIKQGAAKPQKIAIITPNPMEIKPKIREFAELYGLEMELPERPLVQLPHGRALYNLLKIFVDEQKDVYGTDHIIDYNMVIEIMESNLIKETNDNLLKSITMLRAFFEDCKTFAEWYNKLDELIIAKEKITSDYHHHPLNHICKDTLQQFHKTVQTISAISQDLINTNNMTIKDHFKHLINYFSTSAYTNEFDQEFQSRLKNIAEDLSIQNNLEITRLEFAKKIYSLLYDNQNEENIENSMVTNYKIQVSGPNNVEFQKYDYIYIIRFTHDNYPEKISYKWPMNIDLERYLINKNTSQKFENNKSLLNYYADRSIYYLYNALHAANKNLILSYARLYNGLELSPSHYLYDITSTLGIRSFKDINDLEKILIQQRIMFEPVKPQQKNAIPKENVTLPPVPSSLTLSLEDVFLYKYCPRRFMYKIILSNEYIYTSSYHLQHYATSFLHEIAAIEFFKKFQKISKINRHEVKNSLPIIINSKEHEVKVIFPLPQRYWEDVKLRVLNHLENLIDKIILDFTEANVQIVNDRKEKLIEDYNIYAEYQILINNRRKYTVNNLRHFLSFSNNDDYENAKDYNTIKDEYFSLRRDFLSVKNDTIEKIASIIKKIKAKKFQKKIGAHCKYCVFIETCFMKE